MIVAFGHRKQQGKDLSCSLLKQNIIIKHGLGSCSIQSFAKPIYDICHELYRWAGFKNFQYYQDHPEAKQEILPKINKTPRDILIDFGTKGIREQVYSNTWVEYLMHEISEMPEPIILISDLRFPNEVERIRESGRPSILVKVVRPCIPPTDDPADLALEGYDEWDHTIVNDGTKRDLNDQLVDLVLGEIDSYLEDERK